MIRTSYRSEFQVSKNELFAWHTRPGAFARLNPPFEPVQVVTHPETIADGAIAKIRLPIFGPIGIPWTLEHRGFVRNQKFEDHQLRGPFQNWHHHHLFSGETPSVLEDSITCALPGGAVSERLIGWILKRKLSRLFAYRHRVTTNDLSVISKYNLTTQKILLSGANGFIGKSLHAFLTTAGHQVVVLTREADRASSNSIYWNPEENKLDASNLEGFDTVIHLAGETISQRWTSEAKKKILASRIASTRLLVERLKMVSEKPSCFISASGASFYGLSQQAPQDEAQPLGKGFLADVVSQWEKMSAPLTELGIRVCHARFSVVLSPEGGALQKLLLPFRLGLGGPIGNGARFMSCIGKDDLIYGIYHLIATESVNGAVNFSLPQEISNRNFTETLSNILDRPAVIPVPPFALRGFFGEMADETILASTNCFPAKLLDSGFSFSTPNLEQTLRHCLGYNRTQSRTC